MACPWKEAHKESQGCILGKNIFLFLGMSKQEVHDQLQTICPLTIDNASQKQVPRCFFVLFRLKRVKLPSLLPGAQFKWEQKQSCNRNTCTKKKSSHILVCLPWLPENMEFPQGVLSHGKRQVALSEIFDLGDLHIFESQTNRNKRKLKTLLGSACKNYTIEPKMRQFPAVFRCRLFDKENAQCSQN